MKRMPRRIAAVLVAVAATALVMWVGVTVAIALTPSAGARTASGATAVASVGQKSAPGAAVLTCPRSGCTSTYCHGAHGQPPSASRAGSASAAGSGGVAVTAVQTKLGLTPDGVLGSQTVAALEAFQRAHGLPADGVVGPQTRRALGL